MLPSMKCKSLTLSSEGIFMCFCFRVTRSFLPSQPLQRLQLCTCPSWLFVERPWLSLCAPLQGGRFFSTHCPMGPMAGKWPFHQFLPSVGECVSTSKAAVAGPGAQAFPGLHGARTVPGGPGDSQRSCESPAQHLHVDIFYLRGL